METEIIPVVEPEADIAVVPEEDRQEIIELDHRSIEVSTREINEEKRTVRIAVSSEAPVERSFGLEVLEHSESAIDLDFLGSGRAPLLLDHDPRSQIGVIEKTEIGSDAVLRADVRFGKGALADEVFRDVVDGIRTNISVGYRIDKMSKNERSDGTVEFRAVAWTPMETSIVSIPADKSVGVGRSATAEPSKILIKQKEVPMEPEVNIDDVRAEASESARAAYSKQVTEIIALGAKHNKRDFAEESIGKGHSIEQFRGLLLEKIGDAKPLEVGEPDLTPREQNSYSLMRAIRAAASNDWREAGFEREVSDEIGHVSGRTAKGFFVPGHAWHQRDLIAGTDADGGHLKGVNHMGSEFIEALRSRLVVGSMGARVMSGLKGDVSIPKMATVAAAAFVAENNAVAEQNQTFGELALVPRTLGVMTDISRKLMLQSDPSAEAIVRNDLLNAVAAKIESVSIAGGGSNEPTGITGTTGIGSVAIGTNGGAPTFASAVNLVKEVEQDNAAISDSMGYLTNSAVKAKLSSTAKVSSSDSVMILDAPWTELYGYKFGVTNHVPSNLTKGSTSGTCSAMIFGDFSQMILAFWSSPDVLIDPYTNSSKGGTRVVVFQDCDVGIRHAQSFAACLDYTTT